LPQVSFKNPASSNEGPLSAAANGVRVAIRLTPRARADRIDGIAAAADGGSVLKVSVSAPPAENRANDALIAVLAKEWGVPRRDIAIVVGGKSRNKIVHIAGEPQALMRRLAAALAALPAA
jgi:uncharacterized protein (TIGR00251 family)